MINSVIFVAKIKTRTRIIGRRFKKRERKLWRPRKLKRNKNYNLGKENERKRELSQQLILILILVQEIQLCANCIMQLWSEMRQPIATNVAWYVCVCVCLSVCLSVDDNRESYENGWTDRGAIWYTEGLKEKKQN